MILTKKIVFLITISLICIKSWGQDNLSWNKEIGINILQIPATTLDLSYEISNNSRYSFVLNTGYTLNYSNCFDWIGFFLSPHYKCGNDGYSLKKLTGGFIKVGLKYNFRKTIERRNNFYIGAFFTNSLIYEKARFENWDIPSSQVEELNHYNHIFGITSAFGYNFKISEKLNLDSGVQISLPSEKFEDLYGYQNYIPGMGYMETCGSKRSIFPMLVLNLKFNL
jgi:hypothetical protein